MSTNFPRQSEPIPSGQTDWAAWLDENGPRLLLYARQQTRCEEDAEDVLQESLVDLVQAVGSGKFRGMRSQWVAYAVSAIRHRAVDMGRKRNSDDAVKRVYRHGQDFYVEAPWLECSEDDELRRLHLERLLRTLRPEFAEALILRIWEGLSFQEMAEVTGISVSTVNSRYKTALRKLREELEINPLP